MPIAILSQSGAIHGANAAWREFGADDEGSCPLGENYLDWCRTIGDGHDGPAVAGGVQRVLAGVQESYEHTCRFGGTSQAVRVRIRRIEHQTPSKFVLSYEPVAAQSGEDVEDRVLAAQLQERERLAAELHDSVGQSLVCLGLGLTRLHQVSPPESEFASIVDEMAEALKQAHAEIRTLSYLLHPPWPEQAGAFEVAVRQFAEGFARRAGLQARVEITPLLVGLGEKRELTLFRILQEALVNIHRHARADLVEVEMGHRGKHVILKVRDNGQGMSAPEGVVQDPGVGVMGMRSRLRQFGGDLRIVSGEDGTTIVAKLPVSSSAAEALAC